MHPIKTAKDVTKIPNANIEKYVMDLQTVAVKKQFIFFLVLKTSASFTQLKFNRKLFNWLQENNYWITFHAMNMNYSVPLGWFMGMHPTLSSHDALSELLNLYFKMEDIKFNLITTGQFFINKDKKKVKTKVVELHVHANDAERTRELLSCLWFDESFLQEIEQCSISLSIEFIPSIQHGIIDVPTFCECLHHHHEFVTNTIGVSVVSIGKLNVHIQHLGTSVSLTKMIKQLQDNGKPLINGIEPTKYTNSEGHYLLLTQKDLVDKAKEKFDILIQNLAKEGQLSKFQIKGKFLCYVTQVQSKAVATYAASLRARFKPLETVNVPPNLCMLTPTCNAWNQSPSLKLTQDNFPDFKGNVMPSHHHADKKQCTETSSQLSEITLPFCPPQAVGITQTELMDECTEFQAALSTIQTSFADELCKINQNNDNDRKATEECMKVA